MASQTDQRKIVNVGIIGCGEVAQIVHIPTLNYMTDFFRITYLCDTSPSALAHCQKKVSHFSPLPQTTSSAEDVCTSPDVDVVFVLSSDEYHATHAVHALQAGKTVFIEKPMTMNERDLNLMREAEKASKGTVMVGYMRRYAPAFVDAVKEVGGLDKVCYAVVRDLIGTNAFFTSQSGAFPKYFNDYDAQTRQAREDTRAEMFHQGLTVDIGLPVTDTRKTAWSTLGSLGSHDLSAMREALGPPISVRSATMNVVTNFWNATFEYPKFDVHYESGIHGVPIFDAFIEVFGRKKQVKVVYDTPFVKGLPVTMTVREEDGSGSGALRETKVRRTYEDPYTCEMKALYGLMVEGRAVKTTVEDAAGDLRIFQMFMKAAGVQ